MVHRKRVEIRWGDVDAYLHVNNAVYLTYLEECRDEWVDAVLDGNGDAWDFVLARVAIDFRRELKLEDEFKGNGYLAKGHPRMPRALYEAIAELEKSEAAVEIFGQDVVDHYLNSARVEQETYDSIVHPWERERYLERG